MEIEVLERKIRKKYIPPEYVYIAEALLHRTEMKALFSKKLSEIPETFLELAKISYKIHGKIPEIKFTNDPKKQFVELRKDGNLMKINYFESKNRLKITKDVINFLGITIDLLNAVRGFSILENLSYVITDSLKSESFDKMLFLLMTALTAGYGFGFNRAIFFRREGDFFIGEKAIGPFDEKEAHHVWEELEYTHYNLEEFAKHITENFPQSRLQKYISSIRFYIPHGEGSFFDVKDLKIVTVNEVPSSVKEKLLIESDVVLMPITSRYGKSGFFVVDNKFNKEEISSRTIRLLTQFYKQMKLLMENFFLKEKLKELAYHDELTGVKNRRIMEYAEAKPGDVVVMIDLDEFKSINDTFGHEAGDKLLKRFAKLAQKIIRAEDAIFRYGGDEFVLFLRGIDVEKAEIVLERLKKDAMKNSIKFSAGIAKIKNSLEEAIKEADSLMYKAKKIKKEINISKEEEAS